MVKKIKYLLFLLPFLLISNVNASTVGGLQADSPTYAVISTNYNNVPVRIWTPNIFGDDIVDYGTVVNKYVYITSCTDMPTLGYSYTPFYNNTTGNTASATEIRLAGNLTTKTCTFNNGNQGKVVYLKFRLISDLLNVPQGSSSSTWLYNDYITLYIGTNRAFSFSIQNIIALDDDIDIYSNNFDTSILQSQNQTIINNQNSNTNSIINNQNSNTQDIINNQNQNSQQEIESQKVCKKYDKTSIKEINYYLNATGEYRESYSYGITDYINLTSASIKELVHLDRTSQSSMCFYNINKSLISCIRNVNITNPITIPNDSSYVRFSINTTDDKPQFEVCSNGNQALNDSVNDLNDTLNNETSPDTEGYLEDFSENVASDTPITDLITMPLTLINAYINGMNSSCSSYNFGSLLGTELVMPCINLQQRLGNNIWSIIDVLFSIFMIFNISKLFISAFNNFTSLKDDFTNMYTNDYQPKHGGDE